MNHTIDYTCFPTLARRGWGLRAPDGGGCTQRQLLIERGRWCVRPHANRVVGESGPQGLVPHAEPQAAPRGPEPAPPPPTDPCWPLGSVVPETLCPGQSHAARPAQRPRPQVLGARRPLPPGIRQRPRGPSGAGRRSPEGSPPVTSPCRHVPLGLCRDLAGCSFFLLTVTLFFSILTQGCVFLSLSTAFPKFMYNSLGSWPGPPPAFVAPGVGCRAEGCPGCGGLCPRGEGLSVDGAGRPSQSTGV